MPLVMNTPVSASNEVAPRRPNGQLLPGASLNPNGRPRGSVCGRARVVQELDKLLSDEKNLALFRDALQEEMKKDPARFFRTYIMPLLPQEVRNKITTEGGTIRWVSLLETKPAPGGDGRPESG